MTTAVAKPGVTLTFDDGRTFELTEGDVVRGLAYTGSGSNVATVIDGSVRVIIAATKAQNVGPQDCPPEPYLSKYMSVQQIIIDCSTEFDADLRRINVNDIVSIDDVQPAGFDPDEITVGPGAAFRPLTDIIADAPEGAVIHLTKGTYDQPLNLSKSITLRGDGEDTVITGAITVDADIADDAEVTLDQLNLTGDALIKVQGGGAFTMTRSIFGGHNIAAPKTMPVAITSAKPMVITITDNTFNAEPQGAHNLIDVYAQLADGSVIARNAFEDGCCGHNQISLYGLNPGAKVYINDNYAYFSGNMLRIGFKGEPSGELYMAGNKYDTTSSGEDADWAGLFLVQPYNRETISFAGVKIFVNDTVYPAGTNLAYLYAGDNDTAFTDDNKPVVTVDGEPYDIIDMSPIAVAARKAAEEAAAAAAAANSGDDENTPDPQNGDIPADDNP